MTQEKPTRGVSSHFFRPNSLEKSAALTPTPRLTSLSGRLSNGGYMNAITSLTPKQLRHAANVQERIVSLQKELNRLLGGAAPTGGNAAPKRRRMSAAGRARIAAAARARWAKLRGKRGARSGKKGHRRMSAAAKARLAAIARARWAKVKAQGRKAL